MRGKRACCVTGRRAWFDRRTGKLAAAVTYAGQELLGTIGRVTVSIPAGGPGEVLLPVRGGTEAFAAWSDGPVPRHSRVVVVDCMSARSVFVALLP
jgi:hypothetical protein